MNLLNHARQKNTLENIKIEYIYSKKNYNQEWECIMSFSKDNGTKHRFTSQAKKKKTALLSIISNIDRAIFI